jgi:GDP-L-fucose synthase
MNSSDRIYVAGHHGLVGSALVRRLEAGRYDNLIFTERSQIDLREQAQVRSFFQQTRPEYVFLAAAKVGGIHANDTHPADFIRDNLLIQTNIIDAAYRCGARKLVFLGSSCIYPRDAPQPMVEEALLSGPLEPTNQWYAVAKIAGIKMCQAYRRQYGFDAISLMPTNLYGPGDNFDLQTSHVLPALIRKCHEAQLSGQPSVMVWGSGDPKREFLHVDDLADAAVFLAQRYSDELIINVGTGEDLTIRELVHLVARVVGFGGALAFDTSKPDGTPRKLLDVSRLHSLGWRHHITLEQGIRQTYAWYRDQASAHKKQAAS